MTADHPSSQECVFCVAAASGGPDLGTLTLAVTPGCVVLLNRYPYTNGHVMIAPREHESRLYQSGEEALSELMQITARAQRQLEQEYRCDGFNIGMNFGQAGGAGIADHYHVHVVPRWNGDSNFMGVTGSTRIVPEELDVTWKKLVPLFEDLEG